MLLKMNFQSKELKRETQVNVILPNKKAENEEPCRTLWLFHGLTDNHTSWTRYTSIERYANLYNLAVVMPNVDRSWYTDTAYGSNYFAFVTKELPQLCYRNFKGLSMDREYNIVGGLSMGGYGALKAALTYPDQYAACISLSGALDITRRDNTPYGMEEWRGIFGFEMEQLEKLKDSKHDLFTLACENCEKGLAFPKLYLWCGVDDPLLPANQSYHAHLKALGVEHRYEETEGHHTWKWWDLHIQTGLEYVLGNR